jgi:hypothetical protein
MLEKFKTLGLALKNLVLFVVGPLLALFAYVVFLQGKNRRLGEKLDSAEADKRLEGVKHEQESVDAAADAALDEYNRARTAYLGAVEPDILRAGFEPVRQGSASSEKASGDPGPSDQGD